MEGHERLKRALDGVREELEAGLAEAEGELMQLDERRAELITLIAQGRAALGLDAVLLTATGPAMDRLTLHEALAQVLRERANAWAKARELADEVNARRLYVRRDGRAVEVNQVHARVKNYPQLFEKDGPNIRLRAD